MLVILLGFIIPQKLVNDKGIALWDMQVPWVDATKAISASRIVAGRVSERAKSFDVVSEHHSLATFGWHAVAHSRQHVTPPGTTG